MKLDIIAGARPNFMKIAPIIEAIENGAADKFSYRLIHTGQHYDQKMSGSFFEELGIPEPDHNLGAGGGTQAEQTAAIMIGYEKLLLKSKADLCLVVGDVTSTMACAIVAKKAGMLVAHVEAGIRSFDLKMPEEINRMVTDSITDYFYTTSQIANHNLKRLGIAEERIRFVGNTMIDTLLKNMDRLAKPILFDKLDLKNNPYFVLTLHRPSNVDEGSKLRGLITEIVKSAGGNPVIFPVHPRTLKVFENNGIETSGLTIVDPMGYLEFNYLVKHATAVITDSGGITEETTQMGVPCLTLRDNTEREETITIGTNELIGTNPEGIAPAIQKIFAGEWKKGGIPELWDGKAAERIVKHLLSLSPS